MKQTFTDEQLTQALESLRAEATDERFQWLTQEVGEAEGAAPRGDAAGHAHRPTVAVRLRRWGVAAVLAVAVGMGMMMWERFVAVTPSGLNQTVAYNRGSTPACNLNAPSGLKRPHEKPERLAVADEKPEGLTKKHENSHEIAVADKKLEGLTKKHENSHEIAVAGKKPEGLTRPQTGAIAPGGSVKGVSPIRATERTAATSLTAKASRAATTSVPDDLTQLITQTTEAIDEAESRREEMADIVEQYIAFIEP